MTPVRRTAVLLALLAPAGLGEDHAEARDGDVLDRVYGWIGKHHFRTPDGGRIVVPFDPGMADELRARLPAEYRKPERLAKTHVAYLARAPKVDAQRLALARLALATTPRAVIHVLKQRAWRDLDLAWKPVEERRRIEHEAIGKLRQSEEPKAKERARLRHAAGRTISLSAFARWLARPAKKRANLDEATRDRLPGAWFTTYPSYGP